jgi:hypothetical protein
MRKINFIKFTKSFVFIISFAFAILITFLSCLNILKYTVYKDYFLNLTQICENPGSNDDYIPQGITHFENKFITVGYMKNHSNSRIYVIDSVTNKKKYFTLLSNGNDFFGHTGGIQYLNGFLYLADEGTGLYKFPVENIDKISGSKIDIGSPIKLNTNTSFVFGKDEYLYVGEFHKSIDYECKNLIEHNGKTNYAIVEKYNVNDFTKPVEIYSIPEQIQGFCIKDDGTIILSSSWSINSSKLYVYEPESVIKTRQSYNNSEVFFLDEPTKTIKAPAMSEDLDIIVSKSGKSKVITMFESSSNKYFYGKFFFANYIAALDI